MTPLEYSAELFRNQENRIKELEDSLSSLSLSYSKLRSLIPGAYDRPTAPDSETIYAVTEQALERFIKYNIKEEK